MGFANLVPGVSGGTMILVMGLYDDFIAAVANVTRLRFRRRDLLILIVIGGAAATAIVTMAGTVAHIVVVQRQAMFSIFVGLTLGGAPLLLHMIRPFTPASWIGLLFGVGAMVAIAMTGQDPSAKAALKESVAAGQMIIQPAYVRDLLAGVLGMSAMVLPGISGAYMLLILGRYEHILAAIDMAKNLASSSGREGDVALVIEVLGPVALGSLLSLVLLSNVLKWMLRHKKQPTLGFLLGILLGSIVGIWPFAGDAVASDYVFGAVLAVAGFAATASLSKISA